LNLTDAFIASSEVSQKRLSGNKLIYLRTLVNDERTEGVNEKGICDN